MVDASNLDNSEVSDNKESVDDQKLDSSQTNVKKISTSSQSEIETAIIDSELTDHQQKILILRKV